VGWVSFSCSNRAGKCRLVSRKENDLKSFSSLNESLLDSLKAGSGVLDGCDQVERECESLFRAACENDLEGVVARRKYGPYLANKASWLKIRNVEYSKWEGREELL
jgi:ATP-dependent DNA ligase